MEGREDLEEKKEAIKEGVMTCLNLLRPSIREHNSIITEKTKKKIILKKKTFNILQVDSDEENDKENQSMTPISTDENLRRKTVRGSNPTKRLASEKQDDQEIPSKTIEKDGRFGYTLVDH